MATNIWMVGHRVELPEMLQGREQRAERQREFRERNHSTLVCFTLNIAGPVKVFPIGEEVFERTSARIRHALEEAEIPVLDSCEEKLSWGWETYFAAGAPAERVKECLLPMEEKSPAGRLFDIDVLRPDGSKVSREEFGLPPRSCIVCGKPSIACARSRAHSVEEIQAKSVQILMDALREEPISPSLVGKLCRQAMLLEVYTTPKPGLVDRNNTGAHRDMDVALFEKSTSALEPFFAEYAAEGERRSGMEPEEILSYIRPIGIRAEKAMFEATGGVNTHKGMIFSLGILAAATGYCAGRNNGERSDKPDAGGMPARIQQLLTVSAQIAEPAWKHDFQHLENQSEDSMTAGEREYRDYGIGGIRREAAEGFPSVADLSWPVLRRKLDAGEDADMAGAQALLALIAGVTDTNMINRSSLETEREIQQKVRRMLAAPEGVSREQILELDREFIRRNLSPGGCADLLAITYYLYEWYQLL